MFWKKENFFLLQSVYRRSVKFLSLEKNLWKLGFNLSKLAFTNSLLGCGHKAKLNTKEIYALPLTTLPGKMKTTHFKTSFHCKFCQKECRQLSFTKLSLGYSCNIWYIIYFSQALCGISQFDGSWPVQKWSLHLFKKLPEKITEKRNETDLEQTQSKQTSACRYWAHSLSQVGQKQDKRQVRTRTAQGLKGRKDHNDSKKGRRRGVSLSTSNKWVLFLKW